MNNDVKALFNPGLPPRYLASIDIAPELRRSCPISGVASLLADVQSYKSEHPYSHVKTELQKRREIKKAKDTLKKNKLKEELSLWSSRKDDFPGDPRCTLFVGRLRYSIEKEDLFAHFSKHGRIREVTIVREKDTNKSRGYAFIVFEHPSALRSALNAEYGALIKGRRIVTDTERGRIQKSWRPRRLGGGKGGRQGARAQLAELTRKRTHANANIGRDRPAKHTPGSFNNRDSRRPNNRDSQRHPRSDTPYSRNPRLPNTQRWGGENYRNNRDIPDSRGFRDPRDSQGPRRGEVHMDPRAPDANSRRVQQTQAPVNSMPTDPRAAGRALRKY